MCAHPTRSGGLLLWSCVVLMPAAALADPPLHEREAAAAWKALSNEDFALAITHADACINEFRVEAGRIQTRLTDGKVRVPKGYVRPERKDEIFRNAVLNDVAACYFVRARATAKLNQRDESVKALEETMKFPSARAFDSRGWFWAIAEVAQRFSTRPELVEYAPHEVYVADAWDAFNRNDYDQAIALADKCFEEFHAGAVLIQESLRTRKAMVPVGTATSEQKAEVFKNAILNDVAVCLFIKGKAAQMKIIQLVQSEKSGARITLNDAAALTKDALKEVAWHGFSEGEKLTFARCWDPTNEWFWAPSGECRRNLASYMRIRDSSGVYRNRYR